MMEAASRTKWARLLGFIVSTLPKIQLKCALLLFSFSFANLSEPWNQKKSPDLSNLNVDMFSIFLCCPAIFAHDESTIFFYASFSTSLKSWNHKRYHTFVISWTKLPDNINKSFADQIKPESLATRGRCHPLFKSRRISKLAPRSCLA